MEVEAADCDVAALRLPLHAPAGFVHAPLGRLLWPFCARAWLSLRLPFFWRRRICRVSQLAGLGRGSGCRGPIHANLGLQGEPSGFFRVLLCEWTLLEVA